MPCRSSGSLWMNSFARGTVQPGRWASVLAQFLETRMTKRCQLNSPPNRRRITGRCAFLPRPESKLSGQAQRWPRPPSRPEGSWEALLVAQPGYHTLRGSPGSRRCVHAASISRVMEEQQSREFASADATAGAQDAAVQERRFSAEIPVNARRRLQPLQRPTSSHFSPNAPRASGCGDGHMADRRRSGLTIPEPPTLRAHPTQCDNPPWHTPELQRRPVRDRPLLTRCRAEKGPCEADAEVRPIETL